MPGTILNRTIGAVTGGVPGLRRIPVMRLLLLGEVALLLKDHVQLLTPAERRRLVVLIRDARGRPGKLSAAERAELESLIAKSEPLLFATTAARKLSPIPFPGGGKRRGAAS
jgi:hypothetical protein